MMKLFRLAGVTVIVAPLAVACGDSGSGGGGGVTMGPDRTEGHMERAKMEEFLPFFPAAPSGCTRNEQPGMYSGSDASTVSYTYECGTKMFTIVITFSNKIVEQSDTMFNDAGVRDMFHFDLNEVAGRKSITARQRNIGLADFQVVVSNSRSVSIMPASSDLPDKAMEQQIFESLDFTGIANKN